MSKAEEQNQKYYQDAEDLPVFVKWMDFLKWLLNATEKFPKKARYTHVVRINDIALDVVEGLVEARYSKAKIAHLMKVNLNLEKIRMLLRISYESRFMPHDAYKQAIFGINDVGRMIGGWMRQQKQKAAAACFFRLENDVLRLHRELVAQEYKLGPYDQFEIREPKVRKICSSIFRDRIVHHAICQVIEPYFERRLIKDSYACRRGKGTHLALHRAQEFVRKNRFYLKCDIRKYFESVDHAVLKTLLRSIFKDAKLIKLLDQIIDHAAPGSEPGKGIPIGSLASQHFANLYLGELDHYI